jgi:hypothetical protein
VINLNFRSLYISLSPSGLFLHSALNSIISSGPDQSFDKTMAEKVCAWMDVEILIHFPSSSFIGLDLSFI